MSNVPFAVVVLLGVLVAVWAVWGGDVLRALGRWWGS